MDDEENKPAIAQMQSQLSELQKLVELQAQTMNLQTQLLQSSRSVPAMSSHHVRQVKCPEGHYNMTPAEFRSYRQDCIDYKKLTRYSDQEVVMQIRLNMDTDLKRAVDTNFKSQWGSFTVDEALDSISELILQLSNPAVYRRDFDELKQKADENVREFITRLKACSLDCNFVCPYNETHDLTDYHIINRIRSGIHDKQLQQELLQKSDSLKNVTAILDYCESFESARRDRDRLSNDKPAIGAIEEAGLSQEEIVAAISQYKKTKQKKNSQGKCGASGYEYHERKVCPAQGKTCSNCKKPNHFEQVCRFSDKNKKDISGIIGAIMKVVSSSSANSNSLPKLYVQVRHNMVDKDFPLEVVADTGAQVTVSPPKKMKELGLSENNLFKPLTGLQHVGGKQLTILGHYLVTL